MSFTYSKTHNGDYEVIMKEGTLPGRADYGLGKKHRRFCICTHENDAEVIADLLNKAEAEGYLRK